MNKLKLGIIGFGIQGKKYAGFFVDGKVETYSLTAICDISEEVRKQCSVDYKNQKIFSNYKELIDSNEVDTIVITGPHYFHTEIAIYAMKKGINVICEKPAGIYTKEVRLMNEVAESNKNVAFSMMLNQRTNSMYQSIRDLVKSKELGNIRRVNWIVNTSYRPDSYYKLSGWRATWGGEGGGILVNQAPHQIDLLQWICGMPVKMYAKMVYGAHRDIVVDNDVTAVMEFENGATGTFIACTHDPFGTDRFEIDFDSGKIVMEGSKKATVYKFKKTEKEINETMSTSTLSKLLKEVDSGSNELIEISTLDKNNIEFPHLKIFENFADHVFNNVPLIAPGSDGFNGVSMVNAMYLSAWLGKEVTLPVDEELYLSELNKRIKEEGKFDIIE